MLLPVEESFIDKMTDKYDTLSPSFSKVADYLISHYEDAAFMSAAEIANQADVSESVVVRFAAHIGYNGFPQLRRDMQRIVKEKLAPARRLEESDQQEGDPLFRKMVERDRENLVQILDNLSESTFRDATEAMASAKTIYVAGFRGLANLASCLGFLLGLFMPNIRVLVDADTRLFSQLRDIGKDDLLIAFYFKRYDKRTLEAIDMATDVGAQTLTITDSFVSPSAQVSDLTLVCEPESGYFFNSYVTAVAMINILVTGLVRELGLDHVKEKLDELDELLPEEDFVSI